MTEETETPDPNAFERFRKLAKKLVTVPKSEIDKRAKAWKKSRTASEDTEESEE
jgi:hypothetical protein